MNNFVIQLIKGTKEGKPTGVPSANWAKHGKLLYNIAKLASKHLDDVGQEFFDIHYSWEDGIKVTVNSASKAALTFAVSKAAGQALKGSHARLVKSAKIKADIEVVKVNQSKKAVESSQASLDRTAAKSNYKNQKNTVARKQANLNKAKDNLARDNVNSKIAKQAEIATEQSIRTPVTATTNTTVQVLYSDQTSEPEYYVPEPLTSAGTHYYLNRDHTLVYSTADASIRKIENGAAVFVQKKAIDVSQPVLNKLK